VTIAGQEPRRSHATVSVCPPIRRVILCKARAAAGALRSTATPTRLRMPESSIVAGAPIGKNPPNQIDEHAWSPRISKRPRKSVADFSASTSSAGTMLALTVGRSSTVVHGRPRGVHPSQPASRLQTDGLFGSVFAALVAVASAAVAWKAAMKQISVVQRPRRFCDKLPGQR
jgi:hypothetical protein